MNNSYTDISQRQAAMVAGIGLLITLLAVIVGTLVFPKLIVPGDAATTADNIMASRGLFNAGIFSWLLVLIGDVVRAWGLYVFFKYVNKSLSMLAAWFMLLHAAIFGIAQLNFVFVSELLSGADYLSAFEPSQLQSLVLLFINGHNYGFQIGLFFFSFHVLILGYLAIKSGYIPKLVGALLLVASVGYLIDSLGQLFLPNRPEIIFQIFALPMSIAELVLVGWLVWKGGKDTAVE